LVVNGFRGSRVRVVDGEVQCVWVELYEYVVSLS